MKPLKYFSVISLSSLIATSLSSPPKIARPNPVASPVLLTQIAPTPTPTPTPTPQTIKGTQISLNGRSFSVAWSQTQVGTVRRTRISDTGLIQALGVELLNTNNPTQQPIQWFSTATALAVLIAPYRYLDVTELAKTAGWQFQSQGNTLRISSIPAQIDNIRIGQQPTGSRLVVDLNRPTFWRVSQNQTDGIVTIDGTATQQLLDQFKPPTPSPSPSPSPALTQPLLQPIVEGSPNQTLIRVKLPKGKGLRVSTLANPPRLVIDVRSEALVERDIAWANGLRWRSLFVNLGASRFPVTLLETNLRQVTLKPIWSNPSSLVGTAPLIQTSQLWQAAAAINGGFFNRNNQTPLGGIRRDNQWLSSPILNRGAIAWNDTGELKFGRLALQETLVTSTGQRIPLLFLNSGYVQSGIASYTPAWGTTYTPLSNNEIIITVRNNQVVTQQPGGTSGQTAFPIPTDGYLLVLRNSAQATTSLSIGTQIRIEGITIPADFNRYSNTLAAGPLLIQNRQIVLDAKAEGFSDAFIREKAVRSAIATTTNGTTLIVTIGTGANGLGPNLAEMAQLMQQLGVVDALNLDGGSSTSLTLGGQLINRSPVTAARVHNGLGIFLR